MEDHVSQQNLAVSDNCSLPEVVGDGSFASKTHGHDKKLRLFGFEVDLHAKSAGLQSRPEGDETLNSPETGSSKIEKPKKTMQKKYECQFCLKVFANSQALGGHQNAHKKERSEKKKLQLQGRRDSSELYLQPSQHNVDFIYHESQWFYDSPSSSIPKVMLCREAQAQISFNNPQPSASTLLQPFQQDTCLHRPRQKHDGTKEEVGGIQR